MLQGVLADWFQIASNVLNQLHRLSNAMQRMAGHNNLNTVNNKSAIFLDLYLQIIGRTNIVINFCYCFQSWSDREFRDVDSTWRPPEPLNPGALRSGKSRKIEPPQRTPGLEAMLV